MNLIRFYFFKVQSKLSLKKSPNTTISFSQEQLLTQTTSQSYSSFSSMPSNIVEVHKIVSLTEFSYGMMNTFFENLKKFTTEKIALLNSLQEYSKTSTSTVISDDVKMFPKMTNDDQNLEILNQIRLNVQARLHFLSFVYSTLGTSWQNNYQAN